VIDDAALANPLTPVMFVKANSPGYTLHPLHAIGHERAACMVAAAARASAKYVYRRYGACDYAQASIRALIHNETWS
jgi:hypothetical protein